jgi:hypothetical protein
MLGVLLSADVAHCCPSAAHRDYGRYQCVIDAVCVVQGHDGEPFLEAANDTWPHEIVLQHVPLRGTACLTAEATQSTDTDASPFFDGPDVLTLLQRYLI